MIKNPITAATIPSHSGHFPLPDLTIIKTSVLQNRPTVSVAQIFAV